MDQNGPQTHSKHRVRVSGRFQVLPLTCLVSYFLVLLSWRHLQITARLLPPHFYHCCPPPAPSVLAYALKEGHHLELFREWRAYLGWKMSGEPQVSAAAMPRASLTSFKVTSPHAFILDLCSGVLPEGDRQHWDQAQALTWSYGLTRSSSSPAMSSSQQWLYVPLLLQVGLLQVLVQLPWLCGTLRGFTPR